MASSPGPRDGTRETFKAYEIHLAPDERTSHTFHGRDLLAPVAAMLALDELDQFNHCRPISDPVLLPLDFAQPPLRSGSVIYIDHFGNAITNVQAQLARASPALRVVVREPRLGPMRQTYSDVAEDEPLALIGSSGLLEIAVA